MDQKIAEYVDSICSENLELYDGRWHIKYVDESYNSDEIADILQREFNITEDEAWGYIRSWKQAEYSRYEERRQKRIDDCVNFPIPEKVTALLKRLEQVFDLSIEFNEEPVYMYNRGGYAYAMGKGFTLSHCTSSLANGPSYDYSKEIMEILKPFGFEVANSYGDNGMDCETNWHDTYWYVDIVYSPSTVYIND